MTDRNILPEGVRKDIFLNIGEIYALTFDLLQELEERLKYWYVIMTIIINTNFVYFETPMHRCLD